MPSTHTVDPSTSLTRGDLTTLKTDLQREMKQQFRADIEEVLMRFDVRSELRKDLRTEMESLFRERDARRNNLLMRVYLSIMGAYCVAVITAALVYVALGG